MRSYGGWDTADKKPAICGNFVPAGIDEVLTGFAGIFKISVIPAVKTVRRSVQEDLLDLTERLHEASYKFWLKDETVRGGDSGGFDTEPELDGCSSPHGLGHPVRRN